MQSSNLHRSTGRWKLGLVLSLLASMNWGVLPIALKKVLEVMDPVTVTWYRFVCAAAVLLLYIAARNGLHAVKRLRGSTLLLFVGAAVLLTINYQLYVFGLDLLTPNTAQIVIQLAPIFLLLGGLVVFRERFNRFQWMGLAVFVGGLVLFFNERLAELLSSLSGYTIGVLLIAASALAWGAYGLAQKQLLSTFPSKTIMLFLFTACGLFLLPFAHPGEVQLLDGVQLVMLAFCVLNSLVGYGCFVEALAHWEASRVSAVLAITPLFTVASVSLGAAFLPGLVSPDPINALSLIGALLVVAGSMLTALFRGREPQPAPAETLEMPQPSSCGAPE